MQNRIKYLDGQRGLAILLVLFFHAYARWPAIVPYKATYAEFPLFAYGWLGVELFFLISGFVILMTLEKCASIRDFLYRRWLRLFPAMLICSLIIFATAQFFPERPIGAPTWVSLIPGLTFTEPTWWSTVIRHPVSPLEGAFWSLFVEVKFYVFAALVYFWRGRHALIAGLIIGYLVAVLSHIGDTMFGTLPLKLANRICAELSFEYFGWFAAGASFYLHSKTAANKWLFVGLACGLLSAVTVNDPSKMATIAAGLITFVFAATIVSRTVQRFFNTGVLQLFGIISYPLYLIHENLMISSIVKLDKITGDLPGILLPLPVIFLLSLVAFCIARYGEPLVKHWLPRPRKSHLPVLLGSDSSSNVTTCVGGTSESVPIPLDRS